MNYGAEGAIAPKKENKKRPQRGAKHIFKIILY